MSSALSENIRTIRVGISGTSSVESYTLAPGLAQYVEAVYVEVDNQAADAAHPVLTIAEQAGVVIAKRRQGGAIMAGDTGSATWALRLSGDDIGDTGQSGIFFDTDNVGDWLVVNTTDGAPSPPAPGAGYGISLVAQGEGLDLTADLIDIRPDNNLTLFVGRDWRAFVTRNVDWTVDENFAVSVGNGIDLQILDVDAMTLRDSSFNVLFQVQGDNDTVSNPPGDFLVTAGSGGTGDVSLDATNGGAFNATGDGSVTIRANGGAFTLDQAASAAAMQMFSRGTLLIETLGTGALTIADTTSNQVILQASDNDLRIRSGDTSGNVIVEIRHTSQSLTVKDHSGNPIFRVDENGDLHGKTGKSLVFDL